MKLTDDQIKNWKLSFPFLAFTSDEFVQTVAGLIQTRAQFAQDFEAKMRVAQRIKNELFQLIRVGTKFYENGIEKRVSRVTDLVFDVVDLETREIQVRSLAVLKSTKMQNSVSIISF